MKEVYVRVCPRCGGRIHLHQPTALSKMGLFPTEYKCEKCGYVGKYFVEVSLSELEKHRKFLKKQDKIKK